MLKVKVGVLPKILIIAAASINAAWGKPWDIVITSGNDSEHMLGSKHYTFAALDLRISNIPKDELAPYIERLKARLGTGFDVILETNHIHIEHDLHANKKS